MTKQSKYGYGIRGKLISAVCMLLVALIMVVSSTYAWFTLSTAPEVTGITTAVGANGALEMLLLTKDESGQWIYKDGTVGASATWAEKNSYWGNMVDLSDDTTYGLDQITLYPSTLNVANGIIGANMLKTPIYGSDGRVSDLDDNTVTGKYNISEKAFYPDTANKDFGVRAVGVSSGMTPRQLAYRSAISSASTAMSQARNLASQSLNTNGNSLANIAIKHGVASADESYGTKDVDSLLAIVDALLGTKNGTDGVLEYIEESYLQYILAYSASKAVDSSANAENLYASVQALIEQPSANEDQTRLEVVVSGLSSVDVTLPEDISGYINELITTIKNVKDAQEGLTSLRSTENITESSGLNWSQISANLNKLADTDNMEVNGIKASQIKSGDNMSNLVNSVASEGLKVVMSTGGGVYADVADHCGDYSASIVIEEVSYNGLTLKNMTARMETNGYLSTTSEKGPNPYLVIVGNTITGTNNANYPESASGTAMPITEFYGYVIDLAFRTNAAESNLLLQTEGVDRIYNDNNNDETMGSGSSMTFAATTTDFDNDSVKDLMRCIRIVFFTPAGAANEQNAVLAYAKLDVDNATITADGITAPMYIYEMVDTYEYEVTVTDVTESGTKTVYCFRDAGTTTGEGSAQTTTYKYYSDVNLTTEDTVANALSGESAPTLSTIKTERKLSGKDAVIKALSQNEKSHVSTLVYLDGETIGNDDVANAAKSMTGKMNLQFSSSATLVPMEYADLHQTDVETGAKSVPAGTASQTVAIDAVDGATYTLKNAPAGWSIENNVVTVPAEAKAGDTATVTVSKDGKTVKLWTITVTAATT